MKLSTALDKLRSLGCTIQDGKPVFAPRPDKQIAYSLDSRYEITLAGTFTAGDLEALVTLMREMQYRG